MTNHLEVTIAVDMDAAAPGVRPSGMPTGRNFRRTLAVLRRAERAFPCRTLPVDPKRSCGCRYFP